jgi:hypothetical protein
MKRLHTTILLSLLMLLVSCSKDLITPLDPEKIAVVESYLIEGDSTITVSISRLLPFSTDTNEAKEFIRGLQLYLNGELMTETDSGLYQLNLDNDKIRPGIEYSLKFLFYSDTVNSTTTVPEKPVDFAASATVIYADRITGTSTGFPPGAMEDVDLTWENVDDSYYYVTMEYLEETPDVINSAWEDLDLPLIQGIAPLRSSGTRVGLRNLRYFGHYRVVLYKVNSEFADLYQHLESNSNNITNPVTAIGNGYGIFTGMSTDTLFIEVREN